MNHNTMFAALILRLPQTAHVALFLCRLAVFHNLVLGGSDVAFWKSHDVYCTIYCHSSVWTPLQIAFIDDFGCYSMRLRLYSSSLTPCWATPGVEYAKVSVAHNIYISYRHFTRTRIGSVFYLLEVGFPSVPWKTPYFLLFFRPRFVKSRLFSKIPIAQVE